MKKNLLLFSLTLLFGCKTIPKAQVITVGSGGGFTGVWQEYSLKPTGEILRHTSKPDTNVLVMTLSKSDTKKIFKEIVSLDLSKKQLDEPGNMSYFLSFAEGDKFSYRVVWGGKTPPADSVKQFYKSFMEVVNK